MDTLKELFEGNRALFVGLAAENVWDWSKKYPVIRISFGAGVVDSKAKLQDSIDGLFDALSAGDLAGLRAHCHSLLASIPYQWHTNSPVAQYEGYYASVFYSHRGEPIHLIGVAFSKASRNVIGFEVETLSF